MARNQRQRRTGKAEDGPIVPYDDERARVWKIRQQRLYMAIDALVKGLTPSQLCTSLALYAKQTGDDHRLWNISVVSARRVMDDARKELNRDLARDRAKAYSTQMARYEYLYREALKSRDMKQAHAVLNSITELQERISGAGNEQQEGRKASKAGEEIGKAVEHLTRAIARSNRSSRKAPSTTGNEPVEPSVP